MSDPVRLTVLKSIQTALAGMTVSGGYHWTVPVGAVTLDLQNLSTAVKLPAFIVQADNGSTREWMPAFRMKDVFRVMIYGRADAKGFSDTSRRATVFEYLAADIERALTRDITRGGVAIDTRVLPPNEPAVEMDPVQSVYIEQPVEIILRRIYGSPEGS